MKVHIIIISLIFSYVVGNTEQPKFITYGPNCLSQFCWKDKEHLRVLVDLGQIFFATSNYETYLLLGCYNVHMHCLELFAAEIINCFFLVDLRWYSKEAEQQNERKINYSWYVLKIEHPSFQSNLKKCCSFESDLYTHLQGKYDNNPFKQHLRADITNVVTFDEHWSLRDHQSTIFV